MNQKAAFKLLSWKQENSSKVFGISLKVFRHLSRSLGHHEVVMNEHMEIVKTFIHELLHAIEAEWEEPIPHRIVYMLEEGIFKVLKLNKWI